MPKPLTQEQLDALRAVPLGEMPNKVRIALALTKAKQVAIVEETELDAAQVSNIVNGKYSFLQLGTAQKLSTFFGCTVDDLFPVKEAVAS